MKTLIDENKASSQKIQETKASTQKILTNLPTNRNVCKFGKNINALI